MIEIIIKQIKIIIIFIIFVINTNIYSKSLYLDFEKININEKKHSSDIFIDKNNNIYFSYLTNDSILNFYFLNNKENIKCDIRYYGFPLEFTYIRMYRILTYKQNNYFIYLLGPAKTAGYWNPKFKYFKFTIENNKLKVKIPEQQKYEFQVLENNKKIKTKDQIEKTTYDQIEKTFYENYLKIKKYKELYEKIPQKKYDEIINYCNTYISNNKYQNKIYYLNISDSLNSFFIKYKKIDDSIFSDTLEIKGINSKIIDFEFKIHNDKLIIVYSNEKGEIYYNTTTNIQYIESLLKPDYLKKVAKYNVKIEKLKQEIERRYQRLKLGKEKDDYDKCEAIEYLSKQKLFTKSDIFLRFLDKKYGVTVKAEAVSALEAFQNKKAVPYLLELLKVPEKYVSGESIDDSSDIYLKIVVIDSLATLGNIDIIPELEKYKNHESERIRGSIKNAIYDIKARHKKMLE